MELLTPIEQAQYSCYIERAIFPSEIADTSSQVMGSAPIPFIDNCVGSVPNTYMPRGF